MLSVEGTSESLPVSLAQVKRHLGVAYSERDRDIEQMIRAAANYLGKLCKRTWLTTDYLLTLEEFTQTIEIPSPPLQLLTSIQYYSSAGVLTQLTSSSWQVLSGDGLPAIVKPAPNTTWPGTEYDRWNAVQIRFRAGYGDTADYLPPEFSQAALLMLRHWYDNPSAVITGTISKELELSFRSLARSLGTGHYADV